MTTADEWNENHPVGTLVRYHPVEGKPNYRVARTRSVAWNLGHGEPVVKIEGQAGGVALSHVSVHPGYEPAPSHKDLPDA